MTTEFKQLLDFAAAISKGQKPEITAAMGRVDNETIRHFMDITARRYGIDCHFTYQILPDGGEFIETVLFKGMNVERGETKYQTFTFTQNVCAI